MSQSARRYRDALKVIGVLEAGGHQARLAGQPDEEVARRHAPGVEHHAPDQRRAIARDDPRARGAVREQGVEDPRPGGPGDGGLDRAAHRLGSSRSTTPSPG